MRVGGAAVSLRPKTFALLAYLAGQPGRLLTKDELIEAVWPDVTVTDTSPVQCTSELRAAFGDDGQSLIKTVPRRGYLLDASSVGATHADEASGSTRTRGFARRAAPTCRAKPVVAAARRCGWLVLAGRSGSRLGHRGQSGAVVSKNTITILPLAGVGGQNAATSPRPSPKN